MKLQIKDETAIGNILNQIELEVENEIISVKDLITLRVEADVNTYNQKKEEYFHGLVRPSRAERTLNGFKMRERREIDSEKQVYIALDAFLKNGYFVIVNNRQVETLEEELLIADNMDVSFIQLTPLVGG